MKALERGQKQTDDKAGQGAMNIIDLKQVKGFDKKMDKSKLKQKLELDEKIRKVENDLLKGLEHIDDINLKVTYQPT